RGISLTIEGLRDIVGVVGSRGAIGINGELRLEEQGTCSFDPLDLDASLAVREIGTNRFELNGGSFCRRLGHGPYRLPRNLVDDLFERAAPLKQVEVLRIVMPIRDAQIQSTMKSRNHPGPAPERCSDIAECQSLHGRCRKAGLRSHGVISEGS